MRRHTRHGRAAEARKQRRPAKGHGHSQGQKANTGSTRTGGAAVDEDGVRRVDAPVGVVRVDDDAGRARADDAPLVRLREQSRNNERSIGWSTSFAKSRKACKWALTVGWPRTGVPRLLMYTYAWPALSGVSVIDRSLCRSCEQDRG